MSRSRILERVKITLKTGQWWAIPWWHADGYYEDGQINRDKVEESFRQLKETFGTEWIIKERDEFIRETNKWLKEHENEAKHNSQLRDSKNRLEGASEPAEAFNICLGIGLYSPHPLFYEFLCEGLSPLLYLSGLGQKLLIAKKAGHLGEDLIKRIQNKNEYSGAHFELEFLSHLIRNGFVLERNPDSGIGYKKTDFKVSKESEVLFIELKKFQSLSPNRLISRLSMLFFNNIWFDPAIYSVYFKFELSDKLQAKTRNKKGLDYLQNNTELIIKQIKEHIVDRIKNRCWGFHNIPGLAKYEIRDRVGEHAEKKGSFGVFPYLLNEEGEEILTRKIFRKIVPDALQQLPRDQLGVLIINTQPIDLKNFREYAILKFEKDTHKYKHLAAIILVYTILHLGESGEGFQYYFNVALNPCAPNISDSVIVKNILSIGKKDERI